MKRLISRRPSTRWTLAGIVLAVAFGGSAVAATGGTWVVSSSSQVKNGSLQANDLSKKARLSLRGLTGAAGLQGAAGPAGAKGDAGSAGSQGDAGATGANGAVGSIGATGAAGSDGAAGVPGPVGADGAAGAPGADGADGADGATGPQGPIGPSSGIFVFRDEGVTVGSSPTTVLTASSLAAGSYIFWAEASAYNTTSGSYLSCSLSAGGAGAQSDTQLFPSGFWGSGDQLSVSLGATLATSGDAVLSCWSSSGNASISRRRITAIKVGSVSVTNAPGP